MLFSSRRRQTICALGTGCQTCARPIYIAKAMKRAYEKDGVFPEPIRHLAWDYGEHADPHRVARELNGRFLVNVTEKDGKEFAAGKQVPAFAQLRDDGSRSEDRRAGKASAR